VLNKLKNIIKQCNSEATKKQVRSSKLVLELLNKKKLKINKYKMYET